MNIFDVIIIGTGISGLATAISAAEQGLSVVLLSKEEIPSESNTFYAQGGIVGRGINDSIDLMAKDILVAGDEINNKIAVDLLVKEGPGIVDEYLIEKFGVNFCRDDKGDLDRTMEAAHSVRRIFHTKDKTGQSIEVSMLARVEREKKISLFTCHTAVDLITNTHNSSDFQERYRKTRVSGVYAYNSNTGKVNKFFAPSVVLATGGVGNLFLHTSNPAGATGDGISMAYRVGAEILNMEYVQFHPTTLFHRDVKRFLISESVRGEGARLVNKRGEFFMEKYSPELKDLAPRDEVARAIFREMELNGSMYMMLDTSCIDVSSVKERFPGISEKCSEIGIDIDKARERIPVVPAAHYSCGGIKVNLDSMTSIEGLYAVGETACTGVHGANRLASVSLLEGLYFGVRLGRTLAGKRRELSLSLMKSIPRWISPAAEKEFDSILITQDMMNIRTTMWNYAGIIRKRNRLLRALSDLNYLSHRIEKFYKEAKINRELIELRNSVLTSTLIVRAAFANPNSRGCHFIE